ncbi:hypothetical protein SEA_FINNRY_134 [Mycobacterium phage Finnry]|nr:hypothetical protein SEA_FINNRY_134 [Mycobacterium phage Finnry]
MCVCSWALSAVLSAVSVLARVSVSLNAPGRSWALLGSWALPVSNQAAPTPRAWLLARYGAKAPGRAPATPLRR